MRSRCGGSDSLSVPPIAWLVAWLVAWFGLVPGLGNQRGGGVFWIAWQGELLRNPGNSIHRVRSSFFYRVRSSFFFIGADFVLSSPIKFFVYRVRLSYLSSSVKLFFSMRN